MRSRPLIWIGVGLLVLAGAWFFWPAGSHLPAAGKNVAVRKAVAPGVTTIRSVSTAPLIFAAKSPTNSTMAVTPTNPFPYRLSNTTRPLGELMNHAHAILLENALIDTDRGLNLAIPKKLQAQGDPGAYIVQARGPLNAAFRAQLAAAGAQYVSYIPNNACLVRLPAGAAAALAGNALVQAVLPYEPYYKLPASLLAWVGKDYPADNLLRVAAYPDTAEQVETWLAGSGPDGPKKVAEDSSPFGKVFIISNVKDVAALVQSPVLQRAEPVSRRMAANDLARVSLGITTDYYATNANWLGLTGSNVVVEVNDTGIDATHPDFASGRVNGDSAASLTDTSGHGTHVAGIIAGNGAKSSTITVPPQGSVTNADYRGKAPAASLYSFLALNDAGDLNISDYELQSIPALTNALISNNSWVYVGDNVYDLAAASYDAAVRDALPYVTGSQPVLFVFAAGNDGVGESDGTGGEPDTILSPGTAKDVITVGALEQSRGITNTYQPYGTTNEEAVWYDGTDSSFQVADYSARGNVGIGSEGDFGRFKPDVVAPGSFVVSTRSQQWDQGAYYNPSNYYYGGNPGQLVNPDTVLYYSLPVPGNAVSVKIILVSDGTTTFPTNIPIYVSASNFPDPADPGTYDFVTMNNQVFIPPDGSAGYLATILTNGFNYAVGNPTNFAIGYNLITQIITTNDNGNYFEVLSNLNETLAPFYRYESGTSMSAPAVSGTLALIQDYFTNTLHTAPSPALLKAMLINGARSVGNYNFVVTNGINFQGWGEPQIPNSVPPGLTNRLATGCSSFFVEQNPTNALATGASQSWLVTVDTNTAAAAQPLRVTLTWTDPPGNPAAAIKLVNNLDLIVSNNMTGDVYFGNDFPFDGRFTAAWDTNGAPSVDAVNNIENVFLTSAASGSYTVTVLGRSVNVNAVSAQTNNAAGAYAPNVVQDFALVIATGDGQVTNAMVVAAQTPPAPLLGPLVTFVTSTNTLLQHQLAGASTPLLGTNIIGAGAAYLTNAAITLGMTNQWHFYVVTNTLGYTNAAFITFLSQTLATPRIGVFAGSEDNSTQPEADIDLYVATGPGASALTNLDPLVISNCVNGLNGNGASLGNGTGTEFVAYSNSALNQVYYIGVKSETQEAAEYAFLPVFSAEPFSRGDSEGVTVNGLLVPVEIPDGTPSRPGVCYVFALAIQPVEIQNVVVTNTIYHQNFGDLVGVMTHNNDSVVLNNKNGSVDPGYSTIVYDNGPSPIPGSQLADGPGSLLNYQGQEGIGPWVLTEVDNSHTQTGAVTGLTLYLKRHQKLENGVTVTLPPGGYFYGYVDVPNGTTNLNIAATNISATISGETLDPNAGTLYEKLGEQPVPPPEPLTNYDKVAWLTNAPPLPPGGAINVNKSDQPPVQPGRYFVTLWNNSAFEQTYYIIAKLELGLVQPVDFTSAGPTNLLDDAVMYSSIFVTNTLPIATINVGLRVEHPRISDLVFHLISPVGTRYLLMENRGGTSTNGAGVTIMTTNDFPQQSFNGGSVAVTNVVNLSQTSGKVAIDYDFFDLPDQMTVYYQGGLVSNSGLTNGSGTFNFSYGPGTSTNLTIIMNEFGNPNPTTEWNYTIHSIQTNFYYLTLTDDTNLTTTPIKFAAVPFVPPDYFATNYVFSDFETAAAGNYVAPMTVDGWSVISNQVSVLNDPTNAVQGSNFLTLANGVISNSIPTVPGETYSLAFNYRGPGIVSFWRGESNTLDSVSGNNGNFLVSPLYTTNGEVGAAMLFNGVNNGVKVPASPSLNVGAGNSLTIEAWVKPLTASIDPVVEWNTGSGIGYGAQFWLAHPGFGNGNFFANLVDNGDTGVGDPTYWHVIQSPPGLIVTNVYQHIAVTYDKTSGMAALFYNGVQVSAQNLGVFTPQTTYDLYLGERPPGDANSRVFTGPIDEISIYNRALSASEIKAIYTKGAAGKFNPVASLPSSLAEAQISVAGGAPTVFFGNNTNWQATSLIFTATNTATPVVVTGFEPGMLMDTFSLYQNPSASGLVYQPEQSLDPLIGGSAYGLWQLEIQDDRAGATNRTVLDSWRLQITFADTNYIPAGPEFVVLTNRVPYTNSTPLAPGDVVFYQVNVPLNADYATNLLLAADLPVNVWWTTNYPPTVGLPVDFLGITNATSGSFVLNTNGVPPLVPGTTYYLGVENPNATSVTTHVVEVDFHLLTSGAPFAATQPATLVTGPGAQLNGMATPNGFPATAWFEWGTNTLYGSNTPPADVGSGFNVVYTNAAITGLITNVPYHFRLVVSNAFAVTYGFDQVLDQANVVAWGADYVGQINVPTNLSTAYNVVTIAGAFEHNLAVQTNGLVTAWGDNSFGQATVPAWVSNVVAVAGGQYYSIALNANGTVAAWGAAVLNQTNVPAGLSNVVEIAGGTYSSLALKNDGTVVAWGANFFGLTNVPASASNSVAIAGGAYHSLALKNDGTVTAWGDSSSGQTNVPAGLTNVVAIAAGSYHNLALKNDGTVVAWGDNNSGQTNVPVSLTNVVAIAAGGFHNLALQANGTLVTWGDGTAGQLNVPTGLTNIVAISAGYLHSLALTPQSISSLTNPVVLVLTNGVPQTNNLVAGGVTYYQVNVPGDADFATNNLLFAMNGPLNVWFSTNTPPTVAAANDALLLAGVTNGVSVLSLTSAPTNIVPGLTYYLGVQNTNNFTVNYAVAVDFHFAPTNPPVTNAVPIGSIIQTNGGFLLTWFAPSNALFQVQMTTNLWPADWRTFTNPPVVSYNTNAFTSPTNTQFNFFDDGSQFPFGPSRFYRLILLNPGTSSNTPPVLSVQADRVINPLEPLTVTNTATDAESPPQTLTYTLVNPPAGAGIDTNGVITWTPTVAQAGTSNNITTVVTDSGTPNLSATNSFAVVVNPVPVLNSVVYSNGNFVLSWLAPTNDIFTVQVSTNLVAAWQTLATNITYTGPVTPTNGWFGYVDDPAATTVPFGSFRFYRLILTGVVAPPPAPTVTVPIGSITVTNGNFLLTWFASTNDQFRVQWATNLASPISWTPFPGTNTSATGTFTFLDTNAPILMKFYQLILLP